MSMRVQPYLSVEPLEPRRMLATYYVSTGGSDSAAGSSDTPWRTLQHAADRVVAGDTVIVTPGNYVGFDLRTSGTASKRISFKAQSGVVINAVNPVTDRDGINLERASYVTIEGFTLIGTGNPATSRAGIRVVGDGDDEGIFSTGVIVRNNKADSWGSWGMLTGFCDDILIENNEFSRSAREHGLYFSNSGDRPIIRNNISWGNAGCGIHMNADIFTGNTDLPAVDGIISGALVDGNTIYGNGAGSSFGAGGGSAINCDGVRNSRIVNNLIYDNHATGIALYQIDAAAPAVGNVIANNTVIQAADGRFALLVTDGAVNTTVFNNILFNLHGTRGSIDLSADSVSGFKSDYNMLDPRFSRSESFINLSQWRTQTGGDSHSSALTLVQMQALFKSYAGKNFTLAQGSAAIDKGTSGLTNGTLKPAPAIDRLKSPRPAGNGYDIGAYERAASNIGVVIAGTLKIDGTTLADSISIMRAGNTFTITRNGASMDFPTQEVTSIEIYGHDGNDTISIGLGIIGAYVNAGAGDDVVTGGDGDDSITAGPGKDKVWGRGGHDKLTGNQGADKLYGEGGNDRIYGGDGNDYMLGGAGSDRLWAEAGNNTCYGQDGNDVLYVRNTKSDLLNGGAGSDHGQVDSGVIDTWSLLEYLLA
jgi:Ca2+-binding RTX toxin-like protein